MKIHQFNCLFFVLFLTQLNGSLVNNVAHAPFDAGITSTCFDNVARQKRFHVNITLGRVDMEKYYTLETYIM